MIKSLKILRRGNKILLVDMKKHPAPNQFYISVASVTERNKIPAAARTAGMIVYVVQTKTEYRLEEDLTTWTVFSSSNNVMEHLHQTLEADKTTNIVLGNSDLHRNIRIEYTAVREIDSSVVQQYGNAVITDAGTIEQTKLAGDAKITITADVDDKDIRMKVAVDDTNNNDVELDLIIRRLLK